MDAVSDSGNVSLSAVAALAQQTISAAEEKQASEKLAQAPSQEQARAENNKLSLSEEERAVVQQMQARDREVRAHEQAHLNAAAGLVTGGPHYTTEAGPDGQAYAVSGEVNIDTSAVSGDPEATIAKAEQIQAAAMAPAEPSSQDVAVAAQAAQMAAQARAELTSNNSQGADPDELAQGSESIETPDKAEQDAQYYAQHSVADPGPRFIDGFV